MRATHKGELTAGIAILGLLIQQPDTVGGVSHRLATRFGRARFARSAAHNTLPSLVSQGLVEPVALAAPASPTCYRPTGKGTEQFEAWFCESPASPPVARDVLQAKLEFARGENLGRLAQAILREERRCALEYADAHSRLVAARPGTATPDKDLALKRLILSDEATMWALHARRLQRLRGALEALGHAASNEDAVSTAIQEGLAWSEPPRSEAAS